MELNALVWAHCLPGGRAERLKASERDAGRPGLPVRLYIERPADRPCLVRVAVALLFGLGNLSMRGRESSSSSGPHNGAISLNTETGDGRRETGDGRRETGDNASTE